MLLREYVYTNTKYTGPPEETVLLCCVRFVAGIQCMGAPIPHGKSRIVIIETYSCTTSETYLLEARKQHVTTGKSAYNAMLFASEQKLRTKTV